MTTIAEVQHAVCAHFDLAIGELLGDCRTGEIVHPRQIAYLTCRKLTGRSLTNIGRHFGRHHATVLSGIRQAQARISADPDWKAHYEAIKGALHA